MMLHEVFGIVVGFLSVTGSLIAAWLAYLIYEYGRLSRGWLAVVWAFVLIVIRRSLGFLTDFGAITENLNQLHMIESGLLLIISALYIWGFWEMLKRFKSFEIIDKDVRKKIDAFADGRIGRRKKR